MLCAELLFKILPVSTSTEVGYHLDELILTYPSYHRFVSATGWNLENVQRHRSNNFGYLTSVDFAPNPTAVALIGDSFVEASMLPEQQRLASQLSSALDHRPVYALGGPGSSLLDYAERIRFAHQNFGIREFVVVLEQGDIKQSLCGSGNNHGPCLAPGTLVPTTTPREFPTTKRILRHSAFAQYLFSQLKLTPGRLIPTLVESSKPALPIDNAPPSPAASPGQVSAQISSAVHRAFFERIEPYPIKRLVFVLDCDRQALNRGGAPVSATRERFISEAQTRGGQIVDLTEPFKNHLTTTGLKLEVSPHDGHWNAAAIRLVAQATAAQFLEAPVQDLLE
jgi:hypothetical protein